MTFPSIRLEGTILSSDLLDAIERADKNGQEPRDFGFDPGTKVKDEIATTWATAKALWTAYQAKLSHLREGAAGTTETRNLFVIPLLTVFGYAPELSEAETLHGKSYAISHRDNSRDGLPIHIVGPFLSEPGSNPDRSSLDVRVKGVHRLSPHALVQEYLNLTEHLYGIVTNGHKFRLLRDSSRLIKLSFLEFDFERIFGEELFADFALFYRLLHASRMPANRNEAAQSIIERYHQDALDSGSRIRDGLAAAVAFAMQTVANGLLAHPENDELRTQIEIDPGHAQPLHQNLLRWVYRTLFLLVIEERGLNHHPDATLRQRRIYRDYYSLQRLRRLADRPRLADRRHSDLWRSMHQTLRLYEEGGKGRPIGIEPLGSFLFREEGLQPLFQYQLDNRTFLTALNRLSIFQHPDTKNYMRVNYGALDVEEFGSIYESLLELRPRILPGNDHPTFQYAQLAGNERKTTGSYYTPDSLVQQLISTALDPVLEDRLKAAKTPEEKEKALLSLKICDPAVGSGHFLIAAAHRLSRRLAEIRAGDEALSLDVQRHALRDVVSHCLYGVDINPVSVELCKVSLWMLAMEPGKPLSFLDHHIQCGNALLGATPEALEKGIPDAAFKPIEGDEKEYCTKFKKANKAEAKLRGQAGELFDRDMNPWERLGNLPAAIAKLDTLPDDTPEDVRKKAETYEKAVRSADYLNARFLHDAWCAAFVWKKCPPEDGGFDYPITNGELTMIERNPHNCPPWMREETQRLAQQYKFFHWHLAFPEVFGRESGGFEVMLGNPPWERVKLQEKEWFAERSPEIASAPTAAKRKKMIAALISQSPDLHRKFLFDAREAEGASHLLRDSGLFPLCARGDVNLYAVFAEHFRHLLSTTGRFGAVLPSGIATDDTTKLYFQNLVSSRSLVSFYDFENKGIFSGVHSSFKFCLLTSGNGASPIASSSNFAFFCHSIDEIREPGRSFSLSPEDIELLNPNTLTCPIFRLTSDAELIKAIYRRVPVLIRESRDKQPEINPWNLKFMTMFHMSNDSHLFRTREQLEEEGYSIQSNVFTKPEDDEYLPLYEAKMVNFFDHRSADVVLSATATVRQGQPEELTQEDHISPDRLPLPRSWVVRHTATTATGSYRPSWFPTLRDVTASTNERTVIGTVIPFAGVGNNLPLLLSRANDQSTLRLFNSVSSSFALDYTARPKVGGLHLNFFIVNQFAILSPNQLEPFKDKLESRTLELTYTAWDLEAFAKDCGYDGPPFRWDEERRFQLRCELDALFFHLYLPCDDSGAWKPARIAEGAVRDETGEELASLKSHFPTPRHAVAYIMDTFPIVRKKDLKATEQKDESGNVIKKGTYRTKHRILELYDQMLEARRCGTEWSSPLEISPASFRVAHPPRLPDPGTRATHGNDGDLWNHFIRQFLLQARHEANLNLLAEAWQLFANPATLFERRADSLPANDAGTWKAHLAPQVPKQGFHQWVGQLYESGFIHVDRDTLAVTLPEDSALRKLNRNEWINYEVSLALAELAARPDIDELLTGDTRAPEAGKILEFIAA